MSLRMFRGLIALLLLGGCAGGHGPEPFGDEIQGAVGGHEGRVEYVSWDESAVAGGNNADPPGLVSSDPYLLDTGDRLRIFVYGQPNLSRVYVVDQAGKVAVPLIGNVEARGLTTDGLTRVITRRLGTEYVRDPQVTVDLQQNRPFFILGEVRNAGQYPYVSGMTVETAVAIAGGYSERASTRSFRVTRRLDGHEEEFEAPSSYKLKPGDTVFVHERFL